MEHLKEEQTTLSLHFEQQEAQTRFKLQQQLQEFKEKEQRSVEGIERLTSFSLVVLSSFFFFFYLLCS